MVNWLFGRCEGCVMSENLPQLDGRVFLTDAGLETTLIFIEGHELADFASFPLLETDTGVAALRRCYDAYVDVARRDGRGIVLETPTWRANPDWGSRLGYGPGDLDRINRAAVRFIRSLRRDDSDVEIVISGNLGPRGDGYVTGDTMTAGEAADYHGPQVRSFAAAEANLVTALTLTYTDEAIGIARAASEADIASVISFTVETDGALPSGQPLAEAINHVDDTTERAPAYYMVNCAHPTHFEDVFAADGPWERVRGIRANASSMNHEELDNAEELDRGDEAALAGQYRTLQELLPGLAVVGGCCGTDHHHIGAISATVT